MSNKERITVKKCIYCNRLYEGDRAVEDICLSCRTQAKKNSQEDLGKCTTEDRSLSEDTEHKEDGFFNL